MTATKENGFSDDQERKLIVNFTNYVLSQRSGNFPSLNQSNNGLIFGAIRGETSNRGNKLYQNSDLISERKLWVVRREDRVFYSGSEHNLLSRKRMRFCVSPQFEYIDDELGIQEETNKAKRRKRMYAGGMNGLSEGDEEDEDEEENNADLREAAKEGEGREEKEEAEEEEQEQEHEETEDLHKLVDVGKLLAPISSLADIATHPAVSRTFNSTALSELALSVVLMIEKEQGSVISYSRLLEVFLGNIPDALHEANLHLPAYDHKLHPPCHDAPSTVIAGKNNASEEAEDTEEQARNNSHAKEEYESKEEEIKREKSAGCDEDNDSEDPFFALPKFSPHVKLAAVLTPEGGNPDAVETTRQLAQIALQRNQEFIRNLQKIRNCIVKANRIRERVLMWAKEMAGIPEDGVTVPSALHVVKRGLISATTNHMDEEAEDDEGDDE